MKNKERIALIFLSLTLVIQMALLTGGDSSGTTAMDPRTARKAIPDNASERTNAPRLSRPPVSPETLSAFFQTDLPVPTPAPAPQTPIAANGPPETFFRLGVINDSNGIKRLYVKQRENGRVYQARLDGIAEKGIRFFLNGDRAECIEINGAIHTLQKDTQ